MNDLYQDAYNCKSFDVIFGGGIIEISTHDSVILAGWEVTINPNLQQVKIYFTCFSYVLC